jgi:hypothetical protein
MRPRRSDKPSSQDLAARPRCKTSLQDIAERLDDAANLQLVGPHRSATIRRRRGSCLDRSDNHQASERLLTDGALFDRIGTEALVAPIWHAVSGAARFARGTSDRKQARTMDTAFGPDAFSRTAGIHFAARPACTSG